MSRPPRSASRQSQGYLATFSERLARRSGYLATFSERVARRPGVCRDLLGASLDMVRGISRPLWRMSRHAHRISRDPRGMSQDAREKACASAPGRAPPGRPPPSHTGSPFTITISMPFRVCDGFFEAHRPFDCRVIEEHEVRGVTSKRHPEFSGWAESDAPVPSTIVALRMARSQWAHRSSGWSSTCVECLCAFESRLPPLERQGDCTLCPMTSVNEPVHEPGAAGRRKRLQRALR